MRHKEIFTEFGRKNLLEDAHPLRPSGRWEDDIKMDVRWMDLAQDRVQWRALLTVILRLRLLYHVVSCFC